MASPMTTATANRKGDIPTLDGFPCIGFAHGNPKRIGAAMVASVALSTDVIGVAQLAQPSNHFLGELLGLALQRVRSSLLTPPAIADSRTRP